MPGSDAAIVLKGVAKHFRKQKVRREYTTLKTELVRWLKRQRALRDPGEHIEALKSVDLVIAPGQTVGVIGRNGSGKSTLLKLLTGIYGPTQGTVEVHGRVSALLDLGAGFHPDFTGRENILINGIILGMTRAQIKARMQAIIDFAELGEFIDEPVRTYSSGMFMRLAFSVATNVDPDILIIDEILAVGDEHFQKKSMQRMSEFKKVGRTIVLVTHDLGTVQRWCERAVWIDGGRVRGDGPPERVIAEYRRAVAAAEAQAESTGSSALSAPGLALPEVVPAAEQPVVKLSSLTATEGAGTAPVEVQVTFDVAAPASFELVVQLSDSAGRVLFASTLPASVQAIGQARARLTIDHLGLSPGQYTVLAQAFPQKPQPTQELRSVLTLSAQQRPPKTSPSWKLEAPVV
jgi:lipopolysaccharide transport system ATP-binding protein